MPTFTASPHGLILTSDAGRAGHPPAALQRAVARGELVRLRRGAYVDAAEWKAASSRARHILRARAVASGHARQVIFCADTAAAVLGFPRLGPWPDEVHVLTAPAPGGRSKGRVRRHPALPGPVIEVGGLLVTSMARTALDMVRVLDFAPAVGTLDWALWRRNLKAVGLEELHREYERMDPRYGRLHDRAVIEFATTLSDSFGESMTRAGMHVLGYPTPELQVRFTDARGAMDPDYYFRTARVAGEFDGKMKYTRNHAFDDQTASEIVWAEKKREDRLRRQPLIDTVFRVVWSETMHLPQLDRILRDAGLHPVR